MFALVEFSDKSQNVCNIKQVKIINGNECVVKFRSGSYAASLLARGDTREELTQKEKYVDVSVEGSAEHSSETSEFRAYANITNHLSNNENSCNEIYNVSKNEGALSLSGCSFGDITADNLFNEIWKKQVIPEGPMSSTPNSNQDKNETLGISLDTIFVEDFRKSLHSSNVTDIVNNKIFKINDEHTVNNHAVENLLASNIPDKQPNKEFIDDSDTNSNDTKDPEYEPSISESESIEMKSCSDRDSQLNLKIYSDGDRNSFDISKSACQTFSCDPGHLKVEKSYGSKGQNKANFCFYCHKKQLKIARHLELKHNNEECVKKFMNLPKNSKERKDIIAIIRKRGNFLFNTDTNYNDGTLIVTRRPTANSENLAENYLPCGNCKGYYSECSLRHLFAKCTGRSSKKHRIVKIMGKRILGRVHHKACQVVRTKLIPVMKEDDILSLIRYDIGIILYANNMCERYKASDHHHDMIRARMRLLGRFVKTMKNLTEDITDLSSVYDPKYCDDAIRAINIEAGINEIGTVYKTPSVASSLGTLLKKVGEILTIEAIKNHEHEKKKNVKDFLKILTMQVNIKLTKGVIETQVTQRRHKKELLPSSADIKKLNSYLSQRRATAYKKLKKSFSKATWIDLAEVTIISVQLFNRRRPGEIQRILIDDFKNYERIDKTTDKEQFFSLSKKAQKMAMKYVRFTIRGKLNRQVPVLLNNELVQCIELILNYRENAHVKASNPYVFGIPSMDKSKHLYLKACDLMRRFSFECGAENPDRLRGTALRKHIATNVINLNLSEQEVADLANFMGHAEDIHKNIYRQPLVNREIVRMSRLLEAAQGTNEESSDDNNSSDEENNASLDVETESNNLCTSQEQLNNVSMIPKMSNGTSPAIMRRNTPPYGRVQRRPWKIEEKRVVLTAFPNCEKKLPSLMEIQTFITKNPCIQSRTAPQIKTWLHNQTRKK